MQGKHTLPFPKRPFRTHGGAGVPHRKNTAAMESVVMPPPEQVDPWRYQTGTGRRRFPFRRP